MNIEIKTKKRHGVILGALFLGCVDIAECELTNGKTAFVSWGHNYSREKVERMIKNGYDKNCFVKSGSCDSFEVILDNSLIEKYQKAGLINWIN